jgi:hypothetical protein
VAEEAEHGPDEVLLGLGLVLARRVGVEDVANLLHRLSGLHSDGPPVRTPGQCDVQVMVREEAVVAVRPSRRLRGLHGISIVVRRSRAGAGNRLDSVG